MSRVRLTNEVIDVASVIADVARPGAGGTSVFLGTVRDESEGRRVTLLEYEAHAPMALAEMRRCVGEVERAYEGVVVAVRHRVGRLSVGEVAVVCAASAPHRGEAFAACRMLIDTIKARVPIWKREHGPEGAYWVGWRDARCEGEGDGGGEGGIARAHGHGHGDGHGGADGLGLGDRAGGSE